MSAETDCWQNPRVAESEWLELLERYGHWTPPLLPTVVVAPHPDDEVLGAGALIATQLRSGLPVTVIAVTDGEAAYGGGTKLGEVRRLEQEKALGVLGLDASCIVRLRFPDGGLPSHKELIKQEFRSIIPPDSLVVAPWSFDFHPDHEVCGRLAEEISVELGVQAAYYLFWAWHRGNMPLLASIPLRRFPISQDLQELRWTALNQHSSQLHPEGAEPILADSVLGPMRRDFETFVIHE